MPSPLSETLTLVIPQILSQLMRSSGTTFAVSAASRALSPSSLMTTSPKLSTLCSVSLVSPSGVKYSAPRSLAKVVRPSFLCIILPSSSLPTTQRRPPGQCANDPWSSATSKKSRPRNRSPQPLHRYSLTGRSFRACIPCSTLLSIKRPLLLVRAPGDGSPAGAFINPYYLKCVDLSQHT